jgi:hypothetical protein
MKIDGFYEALEYKITSNESEDSFIELTGSLFIRGDFISVHLNYLNGGLLVYCGTLTFIEGKPIIQVNVTNSSRKDFEGSVQTREFTINQETLILSKDHGNSFHRVSWRKLKDTQ